MAETGTQRVTGSRRTLGLVGVTIHAMTLIAPGAFVWLLFPLQLSISNGDTWLGVLVALFAAFLTAAGFSSLAARFPEASNYSAYHYVQRVFSEQAARGGRARWSSPVKFLTGWSAHLFYWVYPGVIIAFMSTLIVYLLRQYGYQPTVFGQALIAAGLAAFLGFLGLRGISGSMTSSILLNVIQIVIVVVFSILAIAFRLTNPLQVPASVWLHPQAGSIFQLSGIDSLLAQAALSIFLVIGFESVVSLGVAAANPRRDIPRGTILALLIQGLVAYSLQYFAFNFALPASSIHPISASPLGDLAVVIGDRLLDGNGFTLMMVVAASVMIAALAAGLTSINTAVRTTFAMALDSEMPGFLGLLHERFSTPYYAVIILTVVSGLIGILGTLGGIQVLLGITLAANLGAFILYGTVCALTLVIEGSERQSGFSRLLAALGVLVNLLLAVVIVWLAAGGQMGAQVAVLFAVIWLLLSAVYYWVNAARRRNLVKKEE